MLWIFEDMQSITKISRWWRPNTILHWITIIQGFWTFGSKITLLFPTYTCYDLSAADQLLMVMIKLRHATWHKDFGHRFVYISWVSKIFQQWIDIMSRELGQLVLWPDHELVCEILPNCFKPKYTRTKCIIDRSDVYIQKPTSLSARAETYSNYKSHNTVKFLVAISPIGTFIFVSKCWVAKYPINIWPLHVDSWRSLCMEI